MRRHTFASYTNHNNGSGRGHVKLGCHSHRVNNKPPTQTNPVEKKKDFASGLFDKRRTDGRLERSGTGLGLLLLAHLLLCFLGVAHLVGAEPLLLAKLAVSRQLPQLAS